MKHIIITIVLALLVYGCPPPHKRRVDRSQAEARIKTTIIRFQKHFQEARFNAYKKGYEQALLDCNCPIDPNWPKEMPY